MAWCFCDICDYKDKCKNYRKVVVCPYMETDELLDKNKQRMEAYFNNSQVLYHRIKKVIDELAKEKPFGELKDGEIVDALEAIIEQIM